mgnify:CR=1 FL=1
MKQYVICMYIRLSSEDTDLKDNLCKDESGSITAQRKLIKDYIASHDDLAVCRVIERCDDGFSGTHFDNRPGFTEMIELTKRGEINCIIVKDFSRFGRNYVELGDYLEQFFPFLGVRFISINDGYDSNDLKDGETGGLDVAFRNLIYDYYSRDISKKIRLAHRQLAESGKFCGAFPLYGYRKSENDKHKLEIDPDTSKIVREIFDMRLSGMTVTDITRNLNERGIDCPAAGLINRGITTNWEGKTGGFIWMQGSVDWILRNEQYTGTLVSLKQRSREIAGKHYRVPEEEWVKVEGTHDAIITKEEYDRVQKMYRTRDRKKNMIRNIYRCGYCGRKMNGQLRGGSMYCMAGTISPNELCKSARIDNADANKAVLKAIQKNLRVMMGEEEARAEEESAGVLNISEQISSITGTLKAKEKAWMKMYDDYSEDKISREEFLAFKKTYDEEVGSLEDRLEQLRAKQAAQAMKKEMASSETYREVMEAETLTEDIMNAFVEGVDVFGDGRLEIHLRADEVC